jgi:hypothetical protein
MPCTLEAGRLSARLNAILEFEPADLASANHTLIVDYVAADDFGHQSEIEEADFRILLGEGMENTIGSLNGGQFLISPAQTDAVESMTDSRGLVGSRRCAASHSALKSFDWYFTPESQRIVTIVCPGPRS